VTTVIEVDMTGVVNLRKKWKPIYAERHGVNLTYVPFVARATMDAIGRWPWVNSEIRGETALSAGYTVSQYFGWQWGTFVRPKEAPRFHLVVILSIVFVAISYYIRLRLEESPVFAELKAQGRTSASPVRESYATRERWRVFAIILFGVVAGQAGIAQTTQVYVLIFLQRVLALPPDDAYRVVAGALLLVMPLFPVVGALSDRIGRKRTMLAGHLYAVVTLYPIYRAIVANADPVRPGMLTFLVFLQMIALVLAYTPLAAFLVEAFPARIRYTSISLPYNLGNGWFGGFLPLIATALVALTGNRLGWLVYPIGLSVVTLIVGGIWVTDRIAGREIVFDDRRARQPVSPTTR